MAGAVLGFLAGVNLNEIVAAALLVVTGDAVGPRWLRASPIVGAAVGAVAGGVREKRRQP